MIVYGVGVCHAGSWAVVLLLLLSLFEAEVLLRLLLLVGVMSPLV